MCAGTGPPRCPHDFAIRIVLFAHTTLPVRLAFGKQKTWAVISLAAGVRAARDEFYRGETARRIAEFHRANEGPLALVDLADFSVEVAPALRTRFGALEVAACGFWCQGPVLLQILNMLDGLDLAPLGHNSPAYLHRIVETIKRIWITQCQ